MKKKKVIIILSILGVIAIIIASIFLPIAVKTIIPSPYYFEDKITSDDLTLEIKNNTLTKKGAIITFNNKTDDYINYGPKDILEHKIFGIWFKIKPKDMFANYLYRLYPIEAKSQIEREVTWDDMYGSLTKGKYRLIKEVIIPSTNEHKYICVEFEIK